MNQSTKYGIGTTTEIKFLRKMLKWTHRDIAEKLGVSAPSVIFWERGSEPRPERKAALSRLVEENRFTQLHDLIPYDPNVQGYTLLEHLHKVCHFRFVEIMDASGISVPYLKDIFEGKTQMSPFYRDLLLIAEQRLFKQFENEKQLDLLDIFLKADYNLTQSEMVSQSVAPQSSLPDGDSPF